MVELQHIYALWLTGMVPAFYVRFSGGVEHINIAHKPVQL